MADEACPRISDPAVIRSAYERYLKDESNLRGGAPAKIYFPSRLEHVRSAVMEARCRGETLTVSGARTGIVGGAVPIEGGSLLSLDRMEGSPELSFCEERGLWTVSVPPSLTVEALGKALAGKDVFYPVDPTETSASLGGTAATNASGARTLYYGPTRNWIMGLTVMLADGSVTRLRRNGPGSKPGGAGADGGTRATGAAAGSAAGARAEGAPSLSFKKVSIGGAEGTVEILLPSISMPDTKHVAGYYVREGMDPIDLFIGGEGTLGIIAGLELALAEKPAGRIGVCVFLPAAEALAPLLSRLRGSDAFTPLALEYMDAGSLEILSDFRREAGASSGIPAIPDNSAGMLYVEASYEEEPASERILSELSNTISFSGIPEERTWAGFDAEIEAMKTFRHALPERINAIVAKRAMEVPGLAKLATDLAVPEAGFSPMMEAYRALLKRSGLPHVLFGHIGNSHLHMNILPRTREELERGREVCIELARSAVSLGGSVSAEHGLGKLKKHLLEVQYSRTEYEGLRSIKRQLDPDGILNPEVLWKG